MYKHLTKGLGALLALFSSTSMLFAQAGVPDYYGEAYRQIVDSAASENSILVYGNVAAKTWQPVIDVCKARHPNMPRVETLDLGQSEVFERYYTEAAGGLRTADLVVSVDAGGWLNFIKTGNVAQYDSPEKKNLPDWSLSHPGVYVFSADPVVMAWSRLAFTDETRPKGVKDLLSKVEADPETFKGKLTTYTLPELMTIYWPFLKAHIPDGKQDWRESEAWALFDRLGESSQPLSSSGQMVDGILSGQYAAAYLTAAGNVRRAATAPATSQLIGYNYVADGTPILIRSVAVTSKASSPNGAKLLLDCILSKEGQLAVAKADYTAYRPDVAGEAKWHLQSVIDEVGSDGVLISSYDDIYTQQSELDAIVQRWRQAMHK